MSNHHIIGRCRVRLKIASAENHDALFNQVSRLVTDELLQDLEKALEGLIPDDVYLKLDRLTINVGQFSQADFATSFAQRIVTELTNEIVDQLKKSEPGKRPENRSTNTLLEHFLITGTLPWWYQLPPGQTPSDWLSLSLKEDPRELLELLRSTISKRGVARRLQYQFSSTSRAAVTEYYQKTAEPPADDESLLTALSVQILPVKRVSSQDDAKASKNLTLAEKDKLLAALRRYLKEGLLSQAYPLSRIREEVYQRAKAGDTSLFDLLVGIVHHPEALERINSGFSPQEMAVIANQLSRSKPINLASSPSPAPAAAPSSAQQLPPQAKNARALLFASFAALRPPDNWWKPGAATYQKHNYAFIIKQRPAEPLALPALVRAWAESLALVSGQSWENVLRHLRLKASDTQLPTALRAALKAVANLLPPEAVKPTVSVAEKPAAEAERDTQQAIFNWVNLISGAPVKGDLRSEKFVIFLADNSRYREALVDALANKKLVPKQLINAVTEKELEKFLQLLAADQSSDYASCVNALRTLILKSQLYASGQAARVQINRYQLLLLLGKQRISSADEAYFIEQFLALVGRETGQTTSSVANSLLSTKGGQRLPSGLLHTLERLSARLDPEVAARLQEATILAGTAARKERPRVRKGHTYRAALLSFLQTGTSPWWEEESLRIEQLFSKAVAIAPKAVAKDLAKYPEYAEKLFPFLSPKELRSFIEGVFTGYADFIFAWTDALNALRDQGILTARQDKNAIWYPAWRFTLQQKGFSSHTFVAEAMTFAAAQFQIHQATLHLHLSTEVAERAGQNDVRYFRLRSVLTEGQFPQHSEPGARPAGASEDTEAGESSDPTPQSYADTLERELNHLRAFYLTGGLPPAASRKSYGELEKFQQHLLRMHPEVARTLFQVVLSDRIARQRLVRFSSDNLKRSILKLLLGRGFAQADRLWTDLEVLLPQLVSGGGEAFRKFILEDFLAYPPLGTKQPHLDDYPTYLLQSIARRNRLSLKKMFLTIQDSLPQKTANLRENWDQILKTVKRKQANKAAQERNPPDDNTRPEMEDSIFVQNSGLVILAPFLPRYFNMLNMLEDRVFKDEETAARAVLLLEYLVSGRTEAAEHELALNKVLCGLELMVPVPTSIELSEQEIEVSRQMMNAILHNWEKMQNSTVESLQGSFLLRSGLLRDLPDNWSLNVESAGYDVLLSFLPWTISVISLPWVGKRIEVNWKTTMG